MSQTTHHPHRADAQTAVVPQQPSVSAAHKLARPADDGVAGLPSAPKLVSPGGRFGAFLLDLLMVVVTLGVGWLMWTLITWSGGQTPAKQILKMVVVDAASGHPLNWGQMFWREFVVRGLGIGILSGFTFGLLVLVDALTIFREDRRTLHDLAAGSSVRYL